MEIQNDMKIQAVQPNQPVMQPKGQKGVDKDEEKPEHKGPPSPPHLGKKIDVYA